MTDLDDFAAYSKLADELISAATKEQVAAVARILALNVAHHWAEDGELPLAQFEELMRTQEIDAETAALLRSAMQTFVGVLGLVLSERGGDDDVAVH